MPEDNSDLEKILEKIKQLSKKLPERQKAEPKKDAVLLAALSFKLAEIASEAALARASGEMSEEKFSGVRYVTEKLMAAIKEVSIGSPQ